MKLTPTKKDASVDIPTEPTPTIATPVREKRPPSKTNTRKAARGKAGTNHNNPSILLPHPAHSIGIERLELVLQLQHQSQTHRNLRCGHRQDEEEHDLPVRLLPP